MIYNHFMNGASRIVQLLLSGGAKRREKRVPKSVFIFLFDASMLNAYAPYNEVIVNSEKKHIECGEFKRQIAE